MNNRLAIRDIAGLLVEPTGKNSESIEQFLSEFVSVVREHIFADRLVQIKSIGNFKIIQVEKRESIDVNTKERFVIPEHYKLSFAPDKDMRETVNKPFAFFESIEMADDEVVPLDGLAEEKDKGDEAEEELDIGETIIENEIEEVGEEPPPPPPPAPAPLPEVEKVEEIREIEKAETETETRTSTILEEPVEYTYNITTEEEEKELDNIETEQQLIDETMADFSENRTRPHDPRSNNNNTVVVLLLVLVVILIISLISVLFLNKGTLFGGRDETPTAEKEVINTGGGISLPSESTTDDFEDDVWPEEESITPDPEPPVYTTPPPAKSTPRRTVRIERGDRLNLFALKYYGNKVFWVYIYQQNQSKLGDPDNIPVGVELVIPAASEYQIDANSPASVKKASVLQSQILASYKHARGSSSFGSSSYGGASSYGASSYGASSYGSSSYPSYQQDNAGYGSQPYTAYPQQDYNSYGTGQYGGSNQYDNSQYDNSYGTGEQYGGSLYDNTNNNTYDNNTQYGGNLYENLSVPPYIGGDNQYNNSNQYNSNPNGGYRY